MKSIISSRVLVPAALVAVLSGSFGVYAQQGGVAERVGSALDNTGRAITGTVRGAVAKNKAKVHSLELVDRIYSRIHWDKALTDATIEIEAGAGGVTVLRGVVLSEKDKESAVELARNTVGVVKVIDELTVTPPVAPTDPAPVVETPAVNVKVQTPTGRVKIETPTGRVDVETPKNN